MNDVQKAWEEMCAYLAEVEILASVNGVLVWDQQTMMPPKANAARGQQLATLSRIVHDRLCDPKLRAWLDTLEQGELDAEQRATVRIIRRQVDRDIKVDKEIIADIARAKSDAFLSWREAKEHKDFSLFAPSLHNLIELTLQRTRCIDPDKHPYEVMLEEYDPGLTLDHLIHTFRRLQEGLTELIQAVNTVKQVERTLFPMPLDRQRQLQESVAKAIGYDLDAGRIDDAEHPFTVGIGDGDVRITSHLYAEDLLRGLSGTVHECGHGMYEQGLPRVKWLGTSLAESCSFGVHESQSRFWENYVGRSLPFFRWLSRHTQQVFPDTSFDAVQMYQSANRVQPSLVRVFADEVTYNLHIIIRSEVEIALLDGSLAVADIPGAWADLYQKYLGVQPANDAEGALQDVHWSSGVFGYFPSYTLGNLYAASLGATLQEALPNLWENIEQGDFAPILQWMRSEIHVKGHMLDGAELIAEVIGDRDPVEDLLNYLWRRHGALYDLTPPR